MKAIKKLLRFVRFSFKVSPGYIILIVFNAIFSSLQIFSNIIFPRFLVNELIGEKKVELLILWGSLIVISNLFFLFYTKCYNRIFKIASEKVINKFSLVMAQKIMNVSYQYLEDPYYLDLKERAVFACNNQSALYRAIYNSAELIRSMVIIIGLVAIMMTLSYLLLIILFVGIVITYLIKAGNKKYETKFYMNLIPINRKYGYYFNFGNKPEMQKDIRLYDINPLLTKTIKKYNAQLIDEFKKAFKRLGLYECFAGIVNTLQTAFIYAYVGIRTATDYLGSKILIGDFMMYISSTIEFSNSFNKLLGSYTDIKQVLAYLEPFFEFMDLKEEKQTEGIILSENIHKIEFRNISFQYPKSDKLVLDNLSFVVNQKEKVSIVGLNGAGKTTLVKLLCRLYQPTSGQILVNDVEIEKYDYSSYISEISAVFQDYRLFNYSIKDNIIGTDNSRVENLDSIITEVGLQNKINSLKNGINSNLNKAYDENGVELSGGEMQKIAIARALYKNSSLIILDEPTSALDPIAEAEIYEHFNSLIADKTALYISHRMSSSIFCDKILVINNGKLQDYDTHNNLMQKKTSLYYQLFVTQAKNYQFDKK